MSQLQQQATEREAETEAAILERAPAKSAFLEGVQSTFQPPFREFQREQARLSHA
jgi:predicted component of type VI protein secretion system